MSNRLAVVCVGLTIASGCGAVSSDTDADPNRPDAKRADDGGIVDEPDAQTTGLLTVTVYNEYGSGDTSASVVFQKADGTVVQRLPTDANGEATSTVDAGDLVTVARINYNGDNELFTFVGVKPGDHLLSGYPRTVLANSSYGEVSAKLAPFDGAAFYRVDTGCLYIDDADAEGNALVGLYEQCHDPTGNIPLYAYAMDSQGRLIAYATRTLANGGAGSIQIDASEWRTDFATTSISVTNSPAESALYPHLYVDNQPLPERFSFDPTLPINPQPGENVNGTAVLPKGLGTGYVYDVEQFVYTGQNTQYRLLSQRKSGTVPASIAIDGAQLLPYLTGRNLVGTGDPQRPKLTWAAAASLAGTDGGIVQTGWYDNANQRYHVWSFSVPAAATEVQLPALPDSLAEYRPSVDVGPREPDVVFIDADGVAGYDAFRQLVRSYTYANGTVFRAVLGNGDLKVRATYVGQANSFVPPRPRSRR